jgi:hypothetical protein
VALAHFRGRQVAGDIEKLPFEDDSFEVIICARCWSTCLEGSMPVSCQSSSVLPARR